MRRKRPSADLLRSAPLTVENLGSVPVFLLATTTVTQLYNIKDNVLIEDDIKEVVSAQFVTKVINQLKVNQMKRIAAKLQAA